MAVEKSKQNDNEGAELSSEEQQGEDDQRKEIGEDITEVSGNAGEDTDDLQKESQLSEKLPCAQSIKKREWQTPLSGKK